jgi:hypothetical protein
MSARIFIGKSMANATYSKVSIEQTWKVSSAELFGYRTGTFNIDILPELPYKKSGFRSHFLWHLSESAAIRRKCDETRFKHKKDAVCSSARTRRTSDRLDSPALFNALILIIL